MEYQPGTPIIANISKQRRATGTVVSVQGNLITVALQQPYRGADGNTHISSWQQRLPACKLSKVS